MVVQALQFKASLENVEEFRIPEDHEWTIDLDQGGATVKENVTICKQDVADIDGSRGQANLVLPSLKANISILNKSDKRVHDSDVEGTYTSENNDQWKTMTVFECRGVEVSKWTLTGGYSIISAGEERKHWKSADVNTDCEEFCDVDEEGNPVRIFDFETRVVTYTPKK